MDNLKEIVMGKSTGKQTNGGQANGDVITKQANAKSKGHALPPNPRYCADTNNEDVSHQIVSSYFMGPKAENFEWFKKQLIEVLEAQRDARLDYYPRDGKAITEEIQSSLAFRKSSRKMTNAIRQASNLMAQHSIPFWSPRYQGHMCMDMVMPAQLGYFMTMLYNPNNVSIEASPITTVAELQVGQDLCKLFGYNIDPKDTSRPVGWGHITCDGTIANLESVWVSRNLKFYPLSIRSAMKVGGPLHFIADRFTIPTCMGEEKLLKDLDTWELLNLKPKDVLDIPERLYQLYYISPAFVNNIMKEYGIQSTSKTVLEKEFSVSDMKYFVCNTRHYSWPKSAAIVGIGSDNVIGIKVDNAARADLNDLEQQLEHCLEKKIGVYTVVAIIGSTEEGAVDPLSQILKMREKFQKRGLSFLVHADGAWGAYFTTMLPTLYKRGEEIALPSDGGAHEGFVPDAGLKTQTAEDLYMIREADSCTVDPHKAAYIPYPAGGLCYKDGRSRYLITWTSPYISRGEVLETTIGVFGVEGSKPGASVMATWLANACIGLGPAGYGKLLGEVTFTCSRLAAEWAAMSTEEDDFVVVPLNELPSEKAGKSRAEVERERKLIRERILQKTNYEIYKEDLERDHDDKAMLLLRELGSDLNINAFGINWKDEDGNLNEDVEEANYFSQLVIQDISVDSPGDDPTTIPFFLTSTTFMIHEYGQCAQHLKKRMGLLEDDTDLMVMRNVVMSPWPTDGYFVNSLIDEYRKVLNKHVATCRKRNDTSPANHEFLLQGTDRIYAIHFPMFNMQKHRRQLIFEVELPTEVRQKYLEELASDVEGMFILSTNERISLEKFDTRRKGFRAELTKRLHKRNPDDVKEGEKPFAYRSLVKDFLVEKPTILKHKSLRAQFRDLDYPSGFVPFYLYGTKKSLCIDHILVKSPNISLSAQGVTLSEDLLAKIPDESLAKGCVLVVNSLSEKALQPFQSTEGSLGETLDRTSNFFFTYGTTFPVTVYEDPYSALANGPGLVDIHGLHKHNTPSSAAIHGHGEDGEGDKDATANFVELGQGQLKLGKGLYIDSKRINDDPFHIPEGMEKYNKWKPIFDSIGKELE